MSPSTAAPDFEHVEVAIEDFNAAIRQDPDLAAAYLFRGLAHRTQGDMAATVADLEEAVRLDPALFDILTFCWSFVVYGDPVDPDAAIAGLEAALALVEPDSVPATIIAMPLD